MTSSDDSPTPPGGLEGWLRLQRGLTGPGNRLIQGPVAGKHWPGFPALRKRVSTLQSLKEGAGEWGRAHFAKWHREGSTVSKL